MFDVGLLYTLNSLSKESSDGADVATSLLDKLDLDSSLSSDEEKRIVSQLEEYNGPDVNEVEALIERIQGTGSKKNYLDSGVGADIPLLRQWATNPEKSDVLSDTTDGYEEFASRSIQTFAQHPNLAAPPIWLKYNGAIRYRVAHDKKDLDAFICDCRFKKSYDFSIVVENSNGRQEIAEVTESGHIVEYRNNAGRLGSRIRMAAMLDWVVPDERTLVDISVSTGMHSTSGISEYQGEEGDVIRETDKVDSSALFVGVVARISNSGNFLVIHKGSHSVIDQGEPGEKYLLEVVSNNRARVISKFKESST